MIKVVEANFIKSAQSIEDSLSPDISEVAFLGRSNVGKSSLLNVLVNKKGLAKSSSTPGKTKLINFFDVTYLIKKEEEKQKFSLRFVDLPGFGYAKVSKVEKKNWETNLTNFLLNRNSIRVFIQLVDARHPYLEIDESTYKFLESVRTGDQKILRVFTKVDKLNRKEFHKLKNSFKDGLFVSNLKKTGVEELNREIFKFVFGDIIGN